jgi:copper transport protein
VRLLPTGAVARWALAKRVVAFVGVALAVWLAGTAQASAHATIVGSDPLDGARLAQPPKTVSVWFDESVGLGSGGYLHVVDPAGRRVDAGTADHPNGDDSRISVAVKPGTGNGTYIASFRIISADSHPVAGVIRFVVGNGTLTGGVTSSATVNPTTSIVFDVARGLAFGGLALLGGAWLLLTVWPQGRRRTAARRIVCGGWALAVVGSAAELLLQGPYAAGAGLSAVSHWSLLDDTLHTPYGTAHSMRLIALGGVAALLGVLFGNLRSAVAALREAAVVLGVGLAVTYVLAGHAATEKPVWLSILSDTAHLTAMSAWLGGLVMLAVVLLPRRNPAELRAVLPVFSKVAFTAVTVLAVSGAYQAWRGVGTLDALTSTTYGRLVLLKIGLFGGLLVLGNLSRLAVQRRYVRTVAYALSAEAVDVQPPAAEPSPAEADRLRRSIGAEVVLAVAVLAATAVLVAEPPGKAATAVQQAKPRSTTVALGGGGRATVRVEPGRHGPVSVTVSVSGVRAQQVTATASLPQKQLGPIPVPLTASSTDVYIASGVVLPNAGSWTFSLTVRTSEFDASTADAVIRLY